ncbi:Alpha/beta hydrolase family protein [Posidoniimonas polymericola]|uniref:Alpha/beta hydrolase family protein n=1 Tax=Posidoniimonas polymericola TaxID=2528002 RepID=A0A5C5XTW2_9BACT|nr:alpha/beta fold hydrolase [Posidoniimonas polymericola]TWT66736.1 Alpha/beta hydrolase family protein [Posidoniimonas polymericola]
MPTPPPRLLCSILLLASALALSGCSSNSEWVTLRESPRNPFAARFDAITTSGGRPSRRTEQLLRKLDLINDLKGDRTALIARLEELSTPATKQSHCYAMAELAYLGAEDVRGRDLAHASELYGTSLRHAYDYLFSCSSENGANEFDPHFRGACDLYNQSLEGLLRLVSKEGAVRPGERRTLKTANHICSFNVALQSSGWHDDDVDRFEFVSDYQVNGLRNHFHSYGLGVPLIAVRRRHDSEDPAESYLPEQLSFPLTAFLRVDTSGSCPQRQPGAPPDQPQELVNPADPAPAFVLELHDPLDGQTIHVEDRVVPLESDLSTPLAYYLNQPALRKDEVSTLGLLKPDSVKKLQGLYMLEPYNPHKMPVLMVHGLWSSPVTWMEMFNDLRSDPDVRDHYQFWFYLYPSGQPFQASASQLRRDLDQLRDDVDPRRRAPALDQMVLVGHSMGGLVSRMQSVDSKQLFWQANTDRPFQQLVADDETKNSLAATYFFRPSPSVRRVVTIGSPHRGSKFANDVTTWLGRKLIAAPMRAMRGRQQLLAKNPGYFRGGSPISLRTSIESLEPDSTLLPPLLTAPPGPWVTYHNIVGDVPESGWRSLLGSEGDGVVSIDSARLDGTPQVASQLVVEANHLSVHRHPQSILEVRRILLEQVTELRTPGYQFPQVQLATGQEPSRPARTAFNPPPARTQ